MSHGTLHSGDLTVVIGDNSAHGDHRAGYNGIWSLTHRSERENLFVPAYSGFNLEHIFDGDRCDSANRPVFFEPRNAAMQFTQISDTAAELHQPATPVFGVESITRFQLIEPHFIDIAFHCTPTREAFPYGYLGLFWASYINAPEDRSIYFRDKGIWQQLCTQAHCHESSVRRDDDNVTLPHREGMGDALFRHDSPLKYNEPFFYGLFRNHVFIQMFDSVFPVRFVHSPGGGGLNAHHGTYNPAWDFMMILPGCKAGKTYRLHSRMVYRERCSRDDILGDIVSGMRPLTSEHAP